MSPRDALDIGLWLLLFLATMHLVYWLVAFSHLLRTRAVPRATAGLALGRELAPPPGVCVIVPAHNEASCIEIVAQSLLAQDYPRLSLVFSLDRCTDDTRGVLERAVAKAGDSSPTVEIIDVEHCPADWAGKPHALWHAATTSPGARAADILLFVDADTRLDPRCTRACVALMRSRGISLLSLLSTLTSDRWFERLVQPAAALELMRQFPLRRSNSPEGKRPFANGQFIMVERAAYDAFGGHESIRSAVLEDVELARQANRHNFRTGVFLADKLLYCRMYTDFAEFESGWKRIYRESANSKPARLRAFGIRQRLLIVLAIGALLAAITGALSLALADLDALGKALAAACTAVGLAALAVYFGVLSACYRMSGASARHAFTYPYGSWMVSRILLAGARDLERKAPIEWAGKAYIREAR